MGVFLDVNDYLLKYIPYQYNCSSSCLPEDCSSSVRKRRRMVMDCSRRVSMSTNRLQHRSVWHTGIGRLHYEELFSLFAWEFCLFKVLDTIPIETLLLAGESDSSPQKLHSLYSWGGLAGKRQHPKLSVSLRCFADLCELYLCCWNKHWFELLPSCSGVRQLFPFFCTSNLGQNFRKALTWIFC